MPVKVSKMKGAKPAKIAKKGRTQEEVLLFLKKNKGTAFHQRDGARFMGFGAPQQFRSAGLALAKKGLIKAVELPCVVDGEDEEGKPNWVPLEGKLKEGKAYKIIRHYFYE